MHAVASPLHSLQGEVHALQALFSSTKPATQEVQLVVLPEQVKQGSRQG